ESNADTAMNENGAMSKHSSSMNKASQFHYNNEHATGKELDTMLLSGRAVRGTYRVMGNYWGEGQAIVYMKSQDDNSKADRQYIYLPTIQHVNRAVDGDIVAIEILPKN